MGYHKEKFSTDEEDPAASWEWYLERRQGPVGLSFRSEEFHSEAVAQNVGKFQIVKFTSTALDYQRTQRHIRADDGEPGYRLLVPLHGYFRFEQGDSREICHPGKPVFFDWRRRLFMSHDRPISAAILHVPEKSVEDALAANAPLALDERRPLVRTLDAQVRLLVEAEGWTAADFGIAYDNVLSTLGGVLNPFPDVKSGNRATAAERARHFIEEHARDRRVTPAVIAAELGISEPTLYRAMKRAGYPSPGAMLRRVRVERAHRRLSRARPVDMDRIAFEEGFSSTRRFREAYRERYGQTPAETREQLFGKSSGG